MQERVLHFANNAISVEYEGDVPSHLVDFLFKCIPDTGKVVTHLNYRLAADEKNGLILYVGDERETSYQSEAGMAMYLMERACFHLADKSQGGLVLHAAALYRNGEVLLLPGTTGSGKSSLTAWLTNQNFDYMTDELSFIPQNSLEIHAFSRPLSLKKNVRPYFRELIAANREKGFLMRTFSTDLFYPEGLTSGKVINHAPLHRIIFPHYQSNANFNLQELTKARTGLALMRCLVNARNLPEHGLTEIARISNSIQAYSMTYGNFSQIDLSIERIFDS